MPTPPVETFPMPALNSEPDTRITIFNHIEFHLHSSLLKLHSAYFRKFIDSLDNALEPSGAQWKYDWIAKVEGDGNWYVVKKAQESQVSASN
ncbi:hypothetical protein OCU04_004990 [Sclerotinia nivalis]|uniref:BTB domain-containing protein n=1 Tax=Sclerotinia nivalis TaxID=352851 RepID=A0A9X0AP08_9HELO|nr:hypothetical protein OCU04_004990 [Sclerotinia nivalis]